MSSENVAALIMNIDIAAYGINLPTASRVYFVSPVWEAAKRQQAIKRAHRIGQTRPVYVETLVVRDSFEHWILDRSVARENEKNKGLGSKDAVGGGRAHRALASDKVMHELFKTLKFFHPMSQSGSSHQDIDLNSLEIPVIYPVRQPSTRNGHVVVEEESRTVDTYTDDILIGRQEQFHSNASLLQQPRKVRFASLGEDDDIDMGDADMEMTADINQGQGGDEYACENYGSDILLDVEQQCVVKSPSPTPEELVDVTEDDEDDLPSPVPEVMDISSESEPYHPISPLAVTKGNQRQEDSKDLANSHSLKRVRFE